MRIHELKTWPEPFQAVLDGRKRYEIRRDDRGYSIGDVLHLREFVPVNSSDNGDCDNGDYTGREHRVVVTYKTETGTWGLRDGLCVLSIEPERKA